MVTDHNTKMKYKGAPSVKKHIKSRNIFSEKNKIEKRIKEEMTAQKYRDRNMKNNIHMEMEKMNLEFLLLNTLTLTTTKVQTVINEFMKDRTYTSIFCFTETKVDCINFNPVGLKMITKQRKKKEKKGGGLAIHMLIMEEQN